MKLPRDISAQDLVKVCKKLGYEVSRQTGSHLRLTTHQNGQHHITIPNHDPIKIGTLSSIINEIANHFNLTKDQIIQTLW